MKVIISVFLSIILACVPCFAYTADSFVIDTDPYVFKQVKSASLKSSAPVMAVGDVAVVADNDIEPISLSDFSIDFVKFTFAGNYEDEDYVNPRPFIENFVLHPTPYITGSGSYHFYSNFNINAKDILQCGAAGLELNLSYELPFNTNSFSIDSDFSQYWYFDLGANGSSHRIPYASSEYFNVFVDGVEVGKVNLINGKFVSDFMYSQSEPINSISIRFWCPGTDTLHFDSPSNISTAFINFLASNDGFSISFMESNQLIDSSNDQAFSDINQHNQIESEWTGSMSQNFAELDLDSFSFPAGAASAFSLISGIFSDLWNSMGDFKIAYVFPLYLGIVLLLVGRLSKFSGGSSSSSKGKSDDNA